MNIEQVNNFSIIVCAYNEELSINKVLSSLLSCCPDSQIVVVNDGSTDSTQEELNKFQSHPNVLILQHPYNLGYGAALKTGVASAKYDWVLFFDADSQHTTGQITNFIPFLQEYDMIVGARQGYKGPALRQPGKWFLKKLASYLVEFNIPDLNSGFRFVKKDLFFKFIHLYPNGFSLTTTITLAAIKSSYKVKYIPITIEKRTGKSTVRPRHALDVMILIVRMISLFSPMRFFVPLTLFLLLMSILSLINDFMQRNFTDTSVILFISTILIFFMGVILDQISLSNRNFINTNTNVEGK